MGKGFNNYMCKKFFHPASRDNLKRVWMAEQKADAYKKKQEELRVQYEKEQDLYNNKALLSKESKDKLSVNFMYEPPPGAKKERQKEDDEPEYKFEWQRKYNAPREDYCKDNAEIRDQPFGIQVRNVRCIKCHKWGHINTDKECPLFNQSSGMSFGGSSKASGSSKETSEGGSAPPLDALTLVQQMREDGLALKRSAMGLQQHMDFPQSKDLLSSDDDDKVKDSDMKFLKSLSTAQKKKLLKKLEKLERKTKGKTKKKSKKKRKHEDSEDEPMKEKQKKHKKRSDCSKKSKHTKEKRSKESKKSKYSESSSSSSSTSSSSSSSSSDSEDDAKQNKLNGSHHSRHDSEKHNKSNNKKDEYSKNKRNESGSKYRGTSPTREVKVKVEKHESGPEDKKSHKHKDNENEGMKRKHSPWREGNEHRERDQKRKRYK